MHLPPSGQPLAHRMLGQDSPCTCLFGLFYNYLQSLHQSCMGSFLGFSFRLAMAAPQSAQEALRAWLNFLSPEQRRAAESQMGAALSASATASDEHTNVDSPAEPAVSSGQADPSTTPIPEEPHPILIAQREWYDSQDKIFQGPVPPETPWQDDDLSAQPSSAASAQPMGSENRASPQAPDQEPWLLPKPDTCLFNIFGEPFQLQNIKEGIAKGQMPKCLLYKDLTAADEQPLNRQEMWAATQYKPIFRTAGRWTYYDLLPEDIRRPPPQFCDEIEDAPIQPPAARTQPKEKARPKQVPPSGRPNLPPKLPQKDSWADVTEEASQPASSTKPKPAQVPKASSEATEPIPKPAQVPKASSQATEPAFSLRQPQPGRSLSPPRSSICALPRPNLFCLRTPSP